MFLTLGPLGASMIFSMNNVFITYFFFLSLYLSLFPFLPACHRKILSSGKQDDPLLIARPPFSPRYPITFSQTYLTISLNSPPVFRYLTIILLSFFAFVILFLFRVASTQGTKVHKVLIGIFDSS